MRKIFILSIIVLLLINNNPAFSDGEPQDDSTPYNPYPEQPAKTPTPPTPPKKSVRRVRARKPAPKPAPRRAVKPAPKPAPNYLQQAINLLNQGRYEAAKPYLIKAIQTNKNDPNVWYWYGKYHEYIGSFYQAQYYFTKAVQIDPSFEPLSRVVYYPNDPLKTPLWDPRRPARIYPVETSGRGITTVPPNARDRNRFPNAPADPQVPSVPVYTPPEPGSTPIDGDRWQSSIYVPPSPDELQTEGGRTPAYIPPSNSAIISTDSTIYNQVTADPVIRTPATQPAPQIVRADKPLYNPPEPGQKINVTTRTPRQPRKPAAPAKTTPTKRAPAKPTRKPATQPSRTRTPARPSTTPATPTPPTRPATPAPTQPARPTTPAPATPARPATPTPTQPQITRPTQPVTPPPTLPPRIEPEPEPQRVPQQQYLPPVGQFSPDPGTISETPIPPVGQRNQD